MKIETQRLQRAQLVLAVVDIQERLLPAIHQKEKVLANSQRLAQGAGILQVPVIVTEQYRKGLGATVPELAAVIPAFTPREKMKFSACGAVGFVDELRLRGIKQVLLCGIEAHVCVTQTALALLADGFGVYVAADAVSSRTPENCQRGIERMRDSGAVIVSTEMALFELLAEAGTEPFKQIQRLVK